MGLLAECSLVARAGCAARMGLVSRHLQLRACADCLTRCHIHFHTPRWPPLRVKAFFAAESNLQKGDVVELRWGGRGSNDVSGTLPSPEPGEPRVLESTAQTVGQPCLVGARCGYSVNHVRAPALFSIVCDRRSDSQFAPQRHSRASGTRSRLPPRSSAARYSRATWTRPPSRPRRATRSRRRCRRCN